MPRVIATWNQVRRYALALPGVVDETSFGRRGMEGQQETLGRTRPLRKSDRAALGDAVRLPAILGVRAAGLEMMEALLRSDAQPLFTTPHFDGYPAVLVQLNKISAKSLKQFIEERRSAASLAK